MTEAEKLFNQIFKRWTERQSFILSFRYATTEALAAAVKRIKAEKEIFVNGLVKSDEYDKIFIDKPKFFEANPPEKLVKEMTEATVKYGQVGVDAASIVFAHSFVDGAALDYCRVTTLIAPRDWEPALDQRQIKLSEIRELGYDTALRKKLDEYLEQLERESLLKKADLLFARCKPPEKWSPMRDYVYDRDHLKILDDCRHDIIHGNEIAIINHAHEEVDYLMRTVLFFMGLVNLRYGIKLDPFYTLTGQELQIPPAEKK
jgi:hypothetical protein